MAYWKQVAGFPAYEINTLGQVWSWHRLKYLKTATVYGYHYVTLCIGGKKCTKRIHVLVLENFRGKKPNGCEARHLDGNKDNNKLSNLKWGTKKENGQDKIKHGTSKINKGVKHGRHKLDEDDIRMIDLLYSSGLHTQQYLGAVFKVGQSVISRIVNKKVWKHVKRY